MSEQLPVGRIVFGSPDKKVYLGHDQERGDVFRDVSGLILRHQI